MAALSLETGEKCIDGGARDFRRSPSGGRGYHSLTMRRYGTLLHKACHHPSLSPQTIKSGVCFVADGQNFGRALRHWTVTNRLGSAERTTYPGTLALTPGGSHVVQSRVSLTQW
jgi:hypothetical protein